MRRWLFLLLLLGCGLAARADQRIYGQCSQGGVKVNTGGLLSSTQVLASYPSCTVSVFVSGTLNLATIYADNARTAKADPFTAASDGSWFFYVPSGTRVDIQMSGGGLASPVTLGDVLAVDIASSPTLTQCVVAFSATPAFTANSCGVFSMTLTGNVTSSTITGSAAGQTEMFSICQDGVGSRTFAWPASFTNPPVIDPTASKCGQFQFVLLADNLWHWTGSGENSGTRNLAALNVSGNATVGGTLTSQTLQGIPHCKNYFTAGVTPFQTGMAACVAALPAIGSGPGIIDARDITDATNLTMTGNLVISRTGIRIQWPCGTITQGTNTISVPNGTNNVKWEGCTPFATVPAGTVNGTVFKYTGSGTAHSFGDTGGTSYGHVVEDIGCDLTGASGSAHCFDTTKVYGAEFNRDRGLCPVAANTMTFIQNNGLAAPGSQSLTLRGNVENNCQFGFTNVNQASPPGCNDVQFIGGQFSGNSAAGGIAIDIECGNEVDFLGPYIGGYETGLKVASPSPGAVWGRVHAETCTTGISFTAAANQNWLWSDTACAITDSNGTNTVVGSNNQTLIFSADGQTNRIKNGRDLPINFTLTPGNTAEQQANITFQNKAAVTQWVLQKATNNVFVIQNATGNNGLFLSQDGSGQNGISAPTTGTLDFNLNNNNSGVARFLNTNGTVVGVQVDNTGTFKPGTAGAVGLGTAALPFSKMFIGGAATNNIQLTGTATGARTQTLQDATGTVLLGSVPPVAAGTAAALTGTGACATFSTQTGGSWAGRATCTAATAASTLTITPGTTAPNGWICYVQDQTTRANLFQQTSTTTGACTLTATSVTQNDVFVFTAIAF